jgi:hypothetical protein
MSVRIFKDKQTGEFAVQTSCLTADAFVTELSEALASAMSKDNSSDMVAFGVLKAAMPIAFKLSGYKADEVSEQRTLLCGKITPNSSDCVASSGGA